MGWGLSTPTCTNGTICSTARTCAVIDFDDCGWGYYVYDMAVTLTDIDDRDDCGRAAPTLS